MFTFTNSSERIFSLAHLPVSPSPSTSEPHTPTPPPPPPSTETAPNPEEVAMLQTLSFPDDDSDDGGILDDGDGTEPIDLSRGCEPHSTTGHTMMDPFRLALFAPKEQIRYPTPEIPGEVLDTISDTETRLMSVFALLRLLLSFTAEQEKQVNVVTGKDDQILDSLLEEERRAQEDEYIEESYFSSTRSNYQTRGSAQEGGGTEENETEDSTVVQDAVTSTTTTTSSSTSSSSSSSSSSQAQEWLDQTLFASDNDVELQSIPSISHPPFSEDDGEYQITHQMNNSMHLIIGSLPRAFVYFMNHMLPKTATVIPQIVLPRLQWFFSYPLYPGSLLPSLDGEFQRLDSGLPEERIASQIIKVLLFSSISESSCERIFSRARFIVGKRRYQLNRRALFSSILVSDQAIKKFLDDH